MAKMKIKYKKTENGRIFQCKQCEDVHLEYKVLNLNLSIEQFKQFSLNIIAIDGKDWERRNDKVEGIRRIFIPIENKKIILMLRNEELSELKELVEQVNLNTGISNIILT